MVERLDARIGDVLKQVDGNTIVIFISDNGADPNGRNEPFRGRKSSVWEGGIRAPLHVRWPGVITPGTVTEQVALTMDLAPTLTAAAGIAAKGFDGDDLLPVMKGRRKAYARTVFWRYRRGKAIRRAVRHGDWKYLNDNGEESLHDLTGDAGEQKSVLAARPEIAADLKRRLEAWEKQVVSPRLREFNKETEG
jgi:arylsulfatase A-like enzyme